MMFISQTIHCTSHDSSYSLLSLNTASGLKIISDLIFVSMTNLKQKCDVIIMYQKRSLKYTYILDWHTCFWIPKYLSLSKTEKKLFLLIVFMKSSIYHD